MLLRVCIVRVLCTCMCVCDYAPRHAGRLFESASTCACACLARLWAWLAKYVDGPPQPDLAAQPASGAVEGQDSRSTPADPHHCSLGEASFCSAAVLLQHVSTRGQGLGYISPLLALPHHTALTHPPSAILPTPHQSPHAAASM